MSRSIFDHALQSPGRTAVIRDRTPITYLAFAQRIEAARRHLARQRLKPRAVAVLCVKDVVDTWVLALALQSLGQTTVAIPEAHIIPQLALRDIAGLVVSGAEDIPSLPPGDAVRLVRVPVDVLAGALGEAEGDAPASRSPAGRLMLTSGTTGVIKKVLIEPSTEELQVQRRVALYQLTQESVVNVFDWGPWSSVGLIVPLAAWSVGGAFEVAQPAASGGFAGTFTHAVATPTMLQRLLADPAQRPWPGAPRLWVTGSALSPAVAADTLARLTPNVVQSVASTEVGVWTATPIEKPADVASHLPIPGRVVQVADDGGAPLPVGVVGRVRVDTLPGVAGYHEDPESTRAWFQDGYFYTGDLGVFGEDGRLTLKGRVSDVVVVGEHKIAAETIEGVVQARFPGKTVAAFATPGAGGEELHLVFEGRPRPPVEALKALVAAELMHFPKVHFHVVDTLPRNDRGKLQRFVLKQRILAEWTPPAPADA
ncbi:MAG: class I adenylate-forming enzyme family protein [Caulobacterales bacterium]